MNERQKTVWLVEDERTFAESLGYILTNISDIKLTKHFFMAEDLIAHIESSVYIVAPDLILMDIRLEGGMNGFEATEILQSIMPDIPVVILTMNDDQKSIIDAMQSGAVGYIVKGDPYDKVIDKLRASMNGMLLISEPIRDHLLGHLRVASQESSFKLTKRQTEVLILMCEGLSKGEIAKRLEISHATADNHFRHIYQKMGVSSAHAAVAIAYKKGLV